MPSKTFNRYIWLLDILLQNNRLGLTSEEICDSWMLSSMSDGAPLSQRTFHQHRKAVEELFGVEIRCNPSAGYRYSIVNVDTMKKDKARQWLFNSFALSNMIVAGHNMQGRILFENIPQGTVYLQLVVEAMQKNKVLELDYQQFGGHNETFHMEPYALRVYRQRWYILGRLQEREALRHLALDRILDMQMSDTSFAVSRGFDAAKYYANSVGIYVDEKLKPQKVRIRVYGNQVEYLRSLPLHHTQKEVLTRHEQHFSEFQYTVCLTPELTTQLLAMGENVEVLEPQELREEMKKRIDIMFNFYN